MKISCTQENLSKAVGVVGRVVGTRSTLPILSHIFISTENGRLKVVGTDLEIGIVANIGAKIEEEGAVTIPARLLADFVVNNKDETINIEVSDNKISLSSDHFKAHLSSLSPEDFPLIPEIKDSQNIKVSAKEIKELITKTVFASAIDETRPVLTGVLIKTEEKTLILAATDSYRLAEGKIDLGENPQKQISAIVPSRTMQELARLIGPTEKTVEIAISENQISFTLSSLKIVSRILDGPFPDYTQIIPKNISSHVEIGLEKLVNALKLSLSFAREVSNNIKVKIEPQQDIQIIATSPQIGDSISTLEADTKGDKLEIAFNARFLLDIISVLDSEKIVIEFSGKTSPAIIRPKNDQKYIALIMPLRLNEL